MRIRITWAKGEITAEINESRVSKELEASLPFESEAKTWGGEIYFKIPIEAVLDEIGAKQVVDPGTVCLWAEGQSIAIPFGPTPISEKGECRLATNVNIMGKVDGDPKVLSSVEDGETLKIDLAD